MEVLACPHCDRLFQVSPAALGKKIRCRGCRGIFHVPHDTTRVPLTPLGAASIADESLPPLAIPCVIDGHDARSCPACSRTFRMKESFAGKTIRCRGCQVTFRVQATEPSLAVPASPKAAPIEAKGPPTPPPLRPALAAPETRPPPPPAPPPPPTIFEDMGDVLEDLVPGERVPSVVRPRTVPRVSSAPTSTVGFMLAVVLGGLCAVPVTLALLRFISPKQFENVAGMLPEFMVAWLR
jgi:ribosomal protein L37AE/L43A